MAKSMDNTPHVLIVDDTPSMRDALEALLFREGYHLAFAASGQEALDRLQELSPDVILLDVMMPGMDGLQVCERLKADERWRHIPTILVTTLDSQEDLVRGLDAGADEFLTKPVTGLELRARVRTMLRIKQQFDELQAALRLREDLANMIVHDLRSPVSVIMMAIFHLGRAVSTPEALKYVDYVESQARRMDSFLTDMLATAKMAEGKLILSRSMVDVNQLVQEVAKIHGYLAESKGRKLVVVDVPKETRQVSLDANLFYRTLDNLISNALKLSPPEGTVTLRAEYPASPMPLVRIQVVDEGPGIPEEDRDRIFDRFEVASLMQQGIPQLGLGLVFCKMVVDAHGGRIFVESNEPHGSIFTVEM